MTCKNQKPTIAVVIPNRNDSAYLKVCLDSVLRQSVRPDQILFVDDQSTDNSVELAHRILDDVAEAEIIVNRTCLGTMGALNEGLKHVKSDYVLFLASNDYLVNGIFERAKSSIAAAGAPGVWSAMVRVTDENGHCESVYKSPVVALKDTFLDKSECIDLAVRLGNWFTGTTLIFRRETLQQIGGFDTDYQGLADLFAALTIASTHGALFCPEPLGVMRLPTEGLFLEVIRRPGLCDELRRQHRISVLGPTNLTAVLYMLQMAFRTLAVQKRSSEVWQVLGAVKAEFDKFGPVLDKVRKKLQEATNTIDDAGRRERAIKRRLRNVEALPAPDAAAVIGLAAGLIDDEAEADGEAAA